MSQRPLPGFVTGTSSEYLGQRPLRKIFRERPLVVILGPKGSGKSAVAMRIANHSCTDVVYVQSKALKDAVVRAVRKGAWSKRYRLTPGLVLDGPTYLRNRPGVLDVMLELLKQRADAGLRTVVCDANGDGSVEELLSRAPTGSTAVLGLRFPSSRSGRLRFARRQCDDLGLPRTMARGTESIEPWGYAAVLAELERRRTDED